MKNITRDLKKSADENRLLEIKALTKMERRRTIQDFIFLLACVVFGFAAANIIN